MKALVPPWPREIPRVFKPIARFKSTIQPGSLYDLIAMGHARQLQRQLADFQASRYTGTWGELLFTNRADYTAFNTSASEGTLLTGSSEQPVIQPYFFAGVQGVGKAISIVAQGVLGTTSTPTATWQVRLGTTAGASSLAGASVGVSSAITTASSVTNKWWRLQLDLTCTAPGQGTNNCTLSGAGYVMCPGGFASPFIYPLEITTPDTATWTQTIDDSLANFLNLSLTWSASSASNTATCKQLWVFGLN